MTRDGDGADAAASTNECTRGREATRSVVERCSRSNQHDASAPSQEMSASLSSFSRRYESLTVSGGPTYDVLMHACAAQLRCVGRRHARLEAHGRRSGAAHRTQAPTSDSRVREGRHPMERECQRPRSTSRVRTRIWTRRGPSAPRARTWMQYHASQDRCAARGAERACESPAQLHRLVVQLAQSASGRGAFHGFIE